MSLFGLSASGETRTARPHQRTAAAGRWTWNQNEYTLLRFFIFFVFSFSDARGTSLKSHSNHVLNQSVSPAESVSLCRFSLFVGQSAGRLLASKVNAFSAARTAESRRGADTAASPQARPCHAMPRQATPALYRDRLENTCIPVTVLRRCHAATRTLGLITCVVRITGTDCQ